MSAASDNNDAARARTRAGTAYAGTARQATEGRDTSGLGIAELPREIWISFDVDEGEGKVVKFVDEGRHW